MGTLSFNSTPGERGRLLKNLMPTEGYFCLYRDEHDTICFAHGDLSLQELSHLKQIFTILVDDIYHEEMGIE